MSDAARRTGTLLLVPNTLDLGTWSSPNEAPDVTAVLTSGLS